MCVCSNDSNDYCDIGHCMTPREMIENVDEMSGKRLM